jgi:hypothetical protein
MDKHSSLFVPSIRTEKVYVIATWCNVMSLFFFYTEGGS